MNKKKSMTIFNFHDYFMWSALNLPISSIWRPDGVRSYMELYIDAIIYETSCLK